jgi:hypothetical protein
VNRRRIALRTILAGAIAAALFAACDKGTTAPSIPSGSFAQLHRALFATSCAVSGCHVSSSAAASGNLVLTASEAYASLVGVLPENLNAKNDGLRRVVKYQPDSSLLYQKIVVASNAHGGAYGGMMPVGTAPVSVGQIEFIRKWIEAGAPNSGYVADSTLLTDATPQASLDFTPLLPPAAGAGFQVKADAFTVHPTFERELFELRPLGNTDKIYVNRIQTTMRPFSHHFLLYTMDSQMGSANCSPQPNVVRDIRLPDNSLDIAAMRPMACHVFFGGSMVQQSDYRFPDGVGLELPANTAIDLNVHYVNHTASVVPGEAYANLYTTPAAAVKTVAHTLNFSNFGFIIPPHKDTTATATFTVSQKTTVFALTSHMHARGTRFEIQIVGGARNGESVYVNTDWEHPQLVTFATPIVLQAGEGLKSIVTWHNESSRYITFGLESTDEMAIIFGYYY